MVSNTPHSPLKYRTEWLIVGWLLVALVIFLSITSSPPQIDIDFKNLDKLEHLFAYSVLMGWFGQLYHSTRARTVCFIGFVVMGIILEIIQGLGGVRYFEYSDMAANAIGALLGWILSRGAGGYFLGWFEKKFS